MQPYCKRFGVTFVHRLKQMHHDDHHHHHHHVGQDDGTANIRTVFWLNTAFSAIEIIGGIYTNSVAILSDAIHDLGDSLSLGFAWYFQKKARGKRDEDFSYGYRRFSLLGAFINAMILTAGSLLVVYEAGSRLFNPVQPDSKGMLVLAIIGIAVNVIGMLRLRRGSSINEKVVSLHFLEDVLGWVAVLIGSIVMMFANVPELDPLLSIVISLYILYNVYRNMKATFRIFLQAKPANIDEDVVRKEILSVAGVKDVHDFHAWTMDGQYNVMTLHAVIGKDQTAQEAEKIKDEIRHRLEHFNVQHSTIEIESEGSECTLEKC